MSVVQHARAAGAHVPAQRYRHRDGQRARELVVMIKYYLSSGDLKLDFGNEETDNNKETSRLISITPL